MNKPIAALSIVALCFGVTTVSACGGKDSTATVCSNLKAIHEPKFAGLSTPEEQSQAVTEFKDFASKLRSDTSNASDSALTTAANKFATDIDSLASDISAGDLQSNPSSVETLANQLSSDNSAIKGFCPNLESSSPPS